MVETKTATFIKDVSAFFTGSAALYQLKPPIERHDIDSDGHDYVELIEYVVAADALIGQVVIGATLYQCDETGYVTSWERMHEKAIADTRDEALRDIGYEMQGGQ